MNHERETLKNLRKSLDDEDDDTNIIQVLEDHHKYLREYANTLIHVEVSAESKQATLSLFLHILNMHAKAEEDVFYKELKNSRNHDIRLEGLKGQDEHDIAFEIVTELKEMEADKNWSEDVDAKVKVLAGLIKTHIKEEETEMFPMAERFILESTLIDLTDDYLDKCKMYLDREMEEIPSDVSMNDVMTFFY